MDIKIGTSTITINCKSGGDDKVARRIKKDATNTSKQYGFNIIGYKICNAGEEKEFSKRPFLTYEQAKEDIELLFKRNEKAKQQVVKFIKDLSNALRNFDYLIRGSSLLIALDEKNCNIKLIDLASIEKNIIKRPNKKETTQIDLGF